MQTTLMSTDRKTLMDRKYELVRNAVVGVRRIDTPTERGTILTQAEVTVGDKKGEKYQHVFPSTSRISKHLKVMNAEDLQTRLNGGTFFFVEGEFVDHRDGMYHGFIHTDDSIDHFVDVLGYQKRSEMPLHMGSNRKRDGDSRDIVLRKVWDKGEILIPKYQGGADFGTELSFAWNPFYKVIQGAFDLIRIICLNGMVGITPLLTPKIPLLNRWEEHLDIASRQIQNKINSMVSKRVDQLVHEPSTVGDCMLLRTHIFNRLHNTQRAEGDTDEAIIALRDKMLTMMAVVEPMAHLDHIYRPDVFNNSSVAAQLPAHLSQFDVFNIATELRTHTKAAKGSSDFALDKFANKIMFGENDDMTVATSTIGMNKDAAFSSPERAFFGVAGDVQDIPYKH